MRRYEEAETWVDIGRINAAIMFKHTTTYRDRQHCTNSAIARNMTTAIETKHSLMDSISDPP
jgi:hypothetical protein